MSYTDYFSGPLPGPPAVANSYNQPANMSPPVYSQGEPFQGPGQNTTPYGYIPRYGASDPAQLQEFSREWGFGQALDAGSLASQPALAANENTRQQYLLAQQMADASLSTQSGYLNQDYKTKLARAGLQNEQLDVQRAALGRQPGYVTQLHDLANQSLNQQAGVARRAVDSAATARGSFTAPGVNQFRTDISDQLANQLGQSDVRYNEQIASIADQNAMLDTQAKNFGLDREQYRTELQRGLERLGLENQITIADLTAKSASTRIEDQVIVNQIINAAMQSSDAYASGYPGFTTPSTSSAPSGSRGGGGGGFKIF